MNISLEGRVALVTGAGMGIGQGVAQGLAASGATVIVCDINRDAGEATAASIRDAGGKATFIAADVSSEAACRDMATQVGDAHGRLDVLVNNAGVAIFKGIHDTTDADWEKIISVDLKGVYVATRAMLDLLKASGDALMVSIASVHAQATIPDLTAYAAAKGGVVAMTRSLAQELGPYGIRVNSISPGFTDTPLLRGWIDSTDDPEATVKRVIDLHPIRKIGTPEDIANAIVFLARDRAQFITGINLTIDGGLTTRLHH